MSTEYDRAQYPLYLYEFRYRDELTGKWRKARYRAELHVIRERHVEFQVAADANHGPSYGTFNPFKQRGT